MWILLCTWLLCFLNPIEAYLCSYEFFCILKIYIYVASFYHTRHVFVMQINDMHNNLTGIVIAEIGVISMSYI